LELQAEADKQRKLEMKVAKEAQLGIKLLYDLTNQNRDSYWGYLMGYVTSYIYYGKYLHGEDEL